VLSLALVRNIRVDDEPSAGVQVLISDSLGLAVKFEFEVAWGEDVEGWGSSVLNDEG
jgi:hypothetical protein